MFSEVAAASPDVGSLSRWPLHKPLQCTKVKLPPPDSKVALLGLEVVAASPKVGGFKQMAPSRAISSILRLKMPPPNDRFFKQEAPLCLVKLPLPPQEFRALSRWPIRLKLPTHIVGSLSRQLPYVS